MSSFNVDFDSVNLDNDFQLQINPTTVPNDIIKESNVVEKVMGFFKKREDVDPKQSNIKPIKKKRSLGCLNFFKRDDANESIHQPTKSILKSKINKNYEAEQSKCKCEESLDFEEFMGRFEYTEQLKNSNKLKYLYLPASINIPYRISPTGNQLAYYLHPQLCGTELIQQFGLHHSNFQSHGYVYLINLPILYKFEFVLLVS